MSCRTGRQDSTPQKNAPCDHLWCQRQTAAGSVGGDEENPIEVFLSSVQIHYTFYSVTPKIFGRTFGMYVLQDFEAMTLPTLGLNYWNCRRWWFTCSSSPYNKFIETTIHLDDGYAYTLLKRISSTNRTSFNGRFILSFSSCKQCLIVEWSTDCSVMLIGQEVRIEATPPKMEEGQIHLSTPPPHLI